MIEDCMAHSNFSQNLTHFCLIGDLIGDLTEDWNRVFYMTPSIRNFFETCKLA